VPPRIKVTTLESQLIHLIQELSGRTLSENQCHVFADFQRPRFLAARGSADRQKIFY
jgi:hypothetical protein